MSKILIIGSGGREHALGWALAKDENVSEVLYAPGNAGTEEGKGRNIKIDGTKGENFEELLKVVKKENVDMIVVGPEVALSNGITNYFQSRGYDGIFGPTQQAALLESDKFFSFDLMNEITIPQARSIKCYSTKEALDKMMCFNEGIVIKARGLTAGKGVTVCESREEARRELVSHSQKYGEEILLAERLFGEEFSLFGISDGKRVQPIEISVQDHKRLFDNDKGPNTGGMGTYCPAPIADIHLIRRINEEIMNPVVRRMREKGIEYKGFLYAGMMMTKEGPKVIEFNARFGDPECQSVMMMVENGLYTSIRLALEGRLDRNFITFKKGASCCVVLASQGYPDQYKEGFVISGLENVSEAKVFHAGTKIEGGRTLTYGGRVLGVCGYSPEGLGEAQRLAYESASKISIPGGFSYRKDIASKGLLSLRN